MKKARECWRLVKAINTISQNGFPRFRVWKLKIVGPICSWVLKIHVKRRDTLKSSFKGKGKPLGHKPPVFGCTWRSQHSVSTLLTEFFSFSRPLMTNSSKTITFLIGCYVTKLHTRCWNEDLIKNSVTFFKGLRTVPIAPM